MAIKRVFQVRLQTCFWVVALAALALGIGLQQQRINRLQKDFNQLQSDNDALKRELAEQPPVREIPLALRSLI